MDIFEAIRQRHSVRSYTDKPIEEGKLEILRSKMEQYNAESGLHIQLVTGDSKAFDSRMAHYGKFSGISNYFAMIGRKGALLDETIGYYGEKLVLEAQMMGLNTCWVGLTFKKNPAVLQIENDEKLRCVIALGYGTTQGISHKIKSFEKVAKAEGTPADWFRKGVEAALLAPTAVNQQKFTFALKGNHQVEAKAGWGFFSKVDLGIVKCHFEIGAGKENFEWL
ncbi:MAG: nitroreductase family protein [Prevotella sp.]|nr:nitroreductase family protein [Prevotella sp.]